MSIGKMWYRTKDMTKNITPYMYFCYLQKYLEIPLFLLCNVSFYYYELNSALIFIFNSFFIHRISILNHYLQHYEFKTIYHQFISLLIFLNPRNSRKSHMAHHIYFNQINKDPDYHLYNKVGNVYIHLIKILFLYYLFKNFRDIRQRTLFSKDNDNKENSTLIRLFFVQMSVFLFFLLLTFNPFYYFIFYFFPLIGAKIINDLRVFTEHYDVKVKSGCLKDLNSLPILTYFYSSYGFNSHKSHHLKPEKKELYKDANMKLTNNHITEFFKILRYG